ncbi:MAG: hypothetical protein U5K36_04320 [Roseovarius sp.]|nr:hypothetical protein [Roseovarius sp.]
MSMKARGRKFAAACETRSTRDLDLHQCSARAMLGFDASRALPPVSRMESKMLSCSKLGLSIAVALILSACMDPTRYQVSGEERTQGDPVKTVDSTIANCARPRIDGAVLPARVPGFPKRQ